MLIIKKLTQQCAPCSRASITILQNGIAISLEGRHLVLTPLASIQCIYTDFFRHDGSKKEILLLHTARMLESLGGSLTELSYG